MRILIVKLSSLGDVVHAMPVVHDILRVHPAARIDWVVEPGFAPLLVRMRGLADVIECPLRRWARAWWRAQTRREWRALRARLAAERYDAILDLQGLTKSALVARAAHGTRYGLAAATDGASHEFPARWLVDHPIEIEPRTHALDRSRELVARALGYPLEGPPDFGLRRKSSPMQGDPVVAFIHGSSRADKLWPEPDWVELGRRFANDGWRIALPQAGADEGERAARLAQAIGSRAAVWPAMDLGEVIDRMQAVQGAIGVDSGLSHIAVALDLPHVQLYNFPTAWRTGPLPEHGHRHQRAVEGTPAPSLAAVWDAWQAVRPFSLTRDAT
ncbi:MAG TPA: lipopolysaccharide heptosyltransferase I [Caldimonas sp.]|nr:lipopolysaccharide heptosyltransferase I [Caldimonas sp.]